MVLLNVNPPPVSENNLNGNVNNQDQLIADLEDFTEEILSMPTNLDSDEPQLETDFHREQIDLLIRLLKYFWRDRQDFYISGNLTVYYNKKQLKSRDFAGPDVFVVLGAEKRDRRSWMVWDEDGKYPNLVIELLSNSTAQVDRGKKKQLYQDIWRVPNYFWFHPDTLEFAGFHLVDGKYEPIIPDAKGYLWSDQLSLFLGIHQNQLRYFTADGAIVPLPEEQERLAKEKAIQRAERLEAMLRSQGIDPDQFSD
jgi:Uma2 family endonuclease